MPEHPQIVHINEHLPQITAQTLIEEAKRNRQGPGAPLEELIASLPETLPMLIDLLLGEFDYRHQKRSNLAVVCRILAVVTICIEEKITGGEA